MADILSKQRVGFERGVYNEICERKRQERSKECHVHRQSNSQTPPFVCCFYDDGLDQTWLIIACRTQVVLHMALGAIT